MSVHHKKRHHPKHSHPGRGRPGTIDPTTGGTFAPQPTPAPDKVPAPPLGNITFFAPRDNLTVTVGLGLTEARITEGFGNWERVDRPHRYQRTQWKGGPDLTLVIPVLFNSLYDDGSVEPAISTLEKMARAISPNETPPRILINADGAVPYDFTVEPERHWLVQQLEFVDTPIPLRRSDGARMLQAVNVTLWAEDAGQIILPAHLHNDNLGASSKKKKHKKVKVHSNDTFSSIAKRHHTTVAELKKLNNVRDTRNWLKTHHEIVV